MSVPVQCRVCKGWYWTGNDCPSAICDVIRQRDILQYELFVMTEQYKELLNAGTVGSETAGREDQSAL